MNPKPILLLSALFIFGCAGHAALTQRSEKKLAGGEPWRAWTLAVKALDRAPGNPRARAAATAAGAAIADDWQRRIHALADVDSLGAAEQVLEFAEFRAGAARYAAVSVSANWMEKEQALRAGAAHYHYRQGTTALGSKRPKKAHLHFLDVQRFVPDYRDAARLADRSLEKARTRVAFVPLRAVSGGSSLGREVAASWCGDVVEHMAPHSMFTRILPVEDVERLLSVSTLGRLSRDEAIRVGQRAGADRVVWGTIGDVDSKTSIQLFSDVVCRRIVDRDSEGHERVRWVDVPIEVIARVRTVTADLEYEVISTRGGATLARRRDPCRMNARAVWTAYVPEGGVESYALVSEPARTANPQRAKQVETRWSAVVGEGTSLAQVLEAKRSSRSASRDRKAVIARYAAGAAFVFLEELPSKEELAFAGLSRSWKPIEQDLERLDPLDDIDLGPAVAESDRR